MQNPKNSVFKFYPQNGFAKLYKHLAVIIAIIVVSHGLLLLNDGLYWDDYLWYFKSIELSHEQLKDMVKDGQYFYVYLNWAIVQFPHFVFSFRLIALCSTLASSLTLYVIGKKTNLLPQQEVLWIAILSAIYPAYQASISNVMMPVHLLYFVFCLGSLCATVYIQSECQLRLILRFCALFCFFVAFSFGSFISFYAVFLIFFVILLKKNKKLNFASIFRLADFFTFPMLYWLFRRFYLLQGQQGIPGYEPTVISVDTILNTIFLFFDQSIYLQFQFSPAQVVIALLIGIFFSAFFKFPDSDIDSKITRINKSWQLLLLGGVIFVISILPYVLTNKPPTAFGLNTRYAFFVGFPFSIMMMGLISLMSSNTAKTLIVVILMSLFAQKHIDNYFNWQARWVKDQSIILNLVKNENLKTVSTILYEDQWHIEGTELFYTTDWWGITRLAFGSRDIFASGFPYAKDINQFEDLIRHMKNDVTAREYYLFKSFDPEGCRVKVTVFAGDRQHTNIGLALRYFYYRFFDNNHLNTFLAPITFLRVEPYYSQNATHCLSTN